MSAQPRIKANALNDAAIEALEGSLHGAVIRASDPEYDEARVVWNGMIDRRPALIVRCLDGDDVIHAVNFGRDNGLLIAIRGGGHNVAGNAVCDGGLIIDLSRMRNVQVDPESRTARVQGGATWSDVDNATQEFGLAVPGGVVSTTGVAGLTLHGGIGHLRRKYGLTIDNLLSVDIVTADGQLRTASETENSDLFWAIRGAGSNFGIVTSFEFRVHPVGPTVMLCAPAYAVEDAPTVLAQWRDFMASAPEEVSSLSLFWSVPADPHFPAELHGTPFLIVAAVYSGLASEGERLLKPLRELATPIIDMSSQEPYVALQSGFDPFFPTGLRYYWKTLYVDHLDASLIAELSKRAGERPSPLSTIDIWHHGGAMNRAGVNETAYGERGATFMISFSSTWVDPADSDSNITWARDGWSALHRYSSTGSTYLNFPGFGEEKEDLLRAAYGEANYERLVDLKTRYDPTNLFRMNQNIPPRT